MCSSDLSIPEPPKWADGAMKTPTPMTFREAMAKWDMTSVLQSGKMATRRAYGVALRSLGHTHKNVWALDADVSNSTFSNAFGNDPE